MPITNKEEALQEHKEIKDRLLFLEREKRDLQITITALEDYLIKLEERWDIE